MTPTTLQVVCRVEQSSSPWLYVMLGIGLVLFVVVAIIGVRAVH